MRKKPCLFARVVNHSPKNQNRLVANLPCPWFKHLVSKMSTLLRICLVQAVLFSIAEAKNNVVTSTQKLELEGDGCDKLIPSFINHITENGDDGECDQAGDYPKPGDCTVYFKCIRGRGRILPFLEYCATGYTFFEDACIPNVNSTDCPQFNCFPVKTTAEASLAQSSSDEILSDGIQKDSDQKKKPDNSTGPDKPNSKILNGVRDSTSSGANNDGQTKIPLRHNSDGAIAGIKTETADFESKEISTAAQKSSSAKVFILAEQWICPLSVYFIIQSL